MNNFFCGILRRRRSLSRPGALAAALWYLAAAGAGAQEAAPVRPELRWSGSLDKGGILEDRVEFRLHGSRPGLTFRAQALDRRPAASWGQFTESFGEGPAADRRITQPGLGIYHGPTGSRVLYGVLDQGGLAARARNIWIRGAPHVESHGPSSADLKTVPSASAKAQGYAYLGSPWVAAGRGGVRFFASCALEIEEGFPLVTAGTDVRFDGGGLLRLEGLYTRRTLGERTSSTWFNPKPALPERDTRLMGGSLAFHLPAFGFAADLVESETFAFGRALYGNLAFRFGDKPWRFSLALDGAGSRFVDSAGGVPGSGFRSALRLERRGRRSSLLRIDALFRGPGPEDMSALAESFDRTSLDLYCRLPVSQAPLALSRFSLGAARDGRKADGALDSAAFMAALKLGPLDGVSEGGLTWRVGTCESRRWSQSLSWTFRKAGRVSAAALASTRSPGTPRPFTLGVKLKAGYEHTSEKGSVWDTALSAAIQGRRSRLAVQVSSPEFPRQWEYSLSWRLQW
ncbi:MAG: hypothetical protein LBD31_01505 [Treponema sp.]|jgi:hypothetical protein|nr:hypothetical protein [Treponema sp.]